VIACGNPHPKAFGFKMKRRGGEAQRKAMIYTAFNSKFTFSLLYRPVLVKIRAKRTQSCPYLSVLIK
jgi:hypothetical protein